MTTYVLDASVAAKWFLPSGETLAEEAVATSYFLAPKPPAPAENPDQAVNINYVHGMSYEKPQEVMPPLVWLTIMIVAFPVVFYLPAHLAFRASFPNQPPLPHRVPIQDPFRIDRVSERARVSRLCSQQGRSPSIDRDQRPDCLDQAERPRALEESIRRTHRTGASESEDEPRASILECVEEQHGGDGEQPEKRQRVHRGSLFLLDWSATTFR